MSKYVCVFLIVLVIAILGIAFNFYLHKEVDPPKNIIVFNGDKVSLSAPLVAEGNYMLAPVEDVSRLLGAVIEKKPENGIQIVKGDMVLGLKLNSKEIQVNGKVEMMPVPLAESMGVIMAPIRFLAEKLGADVAWDFENNTILMNTVGKNIIVFLGDSLTANFDLQKYFPGAVNKGKAGDTTFGALGRLDKVTMMKPGKLFIMLGINDIWRNIEHDVTAANYRHLIEIVRISSPETDIILQSIIPFGNEAFKKNAGASNEKVASLNKEIKALADAFHLKYVDIGSLYQDSSGMMDSRYSSDGIHISDSSYKIWADAIKELVKS